MLLSKNHDPKMFQNIMNRIVWKCFLFSLHFQWSLRFLEKAFIWLQKVSSTKTLPTSKVESLVKPNFDLNQTCKIILIQNHEIWSFNATELIDILIKDRRKLLHLWKMSKNWSLEVLGRVKTKYMFA